MLANENDSSDDDNVVTVMCRVVHVLMSVVNNEDQVMIIRKGKPQIQMQLQKQERVWNRKYFVQNLTPGLRRWNLVEHYYSTKKGGRQNP